MNCFRRTNSVHSCSIVLLDGTELSEEIRDDTLGQELLDAVLRRLGIQETSYFGLRYVHASRQPHWLNPNKKVHRQLKGTSPFTLYFCVKYYATDPCKLRDEITRYQFFLQVKKDIVDGRLPVPQELSAELSACVAQSELGDFEASLHGEGYCRQFQLNPMEPASEQAISALHRSLKGRSPAEAEAAFLEKVRWLDMYGTDLYPVMGEDSADTFVGLAPSGVRVIRGKGRVSNYFWHRISKAFCKKDCLVIKTRDNNNEEQTISFRCASRLACQLLLQSCLEQQEFFRQALVSPPAANGSKGGRSDSRRGSTVTSSVRQCGRRETSRLSSAEPEQPPLARDGDSATPSSCHKSVSIPQPVQSATSLYRANSVSAETKTSPAGSPRSVRSALLSTNQVASLFNTQPISKSRSRTSVDSQSSADSRTQRRNRHRREGSAGSDVSSGASSARSSRRYRNRRAESGSDSDRSGGSRRHRSRRHRHHAAADVDELIDSEPQWREVQRLQAERLRPSGYQNSGMETETELSYQPKRRVKRHSRSRSRSRSPETNRNRRLPVELRRHLQFGLVEPPADPSADLQYTRVTTEHKMPRIRYAAKRSQKGGSVDGRSETSEPPLSVAAPPQDTTTDRALPPTAAYPAVSAAYPSTAATYTAPGVPYQAAGVPHPPPSAAPQSARSAAPGLQGRTAAGERIREATARTGRESSPAAIGSGQTRLTPGQVSLPADSPYDNSDSGLGNESPTEFTRLSAQASLQNGVGASRAMTSHGEPRVVRTLDTMTSL